MTSKAVLSPTISISGQAPKAAPISRIAVVTGSRSELGLLRPILHAIKSEPRLDLQVLACGEHDSRLSGSIEEVRQEFGKSMINLCAPNEPRATNAGNNRSFAARMAGDMLQLAMEFDRKKPDVALVLGDRIEAFAGAASAAVSGVLVAHVHGGDRAEGFADESLRHAISKLAHLHFAATDTSANRLIAMGEAPCRVHIVGSPALDDLASFPPLTDDSFRAFGEPEIVVLLHPVGDAPAIEYERASELLALCASHARTLALQPNHDPGRAGIADAIQASGLMNRAHLPRRDFVGLLRRARVLVGNSSAGLIEAAALPIWSVNIGERQAGRERAGNVIDIDRWDYRAISDGVDRALREPIPPILHAYGDGHAGERIAHILATSDLASVSRRKRNTY